MNTRFSRVFFCLIALRETIDRTELMGIYNCICYNSLKISLKMIVSMDRNHILEELKVVVGESFGCKLCVCLRKAPEVCSQYRYSF